MPHHKGGGKTGGLKLDEHVYVKLVVQTFGIEKANRILASSGVPTLSKVDEPQIPEEKVETLKFRYREAVRALMWTATMTLPDFACAVRAVARFYENPGLAHKKTALKVCLGYSVLDAGLSCTKGVWYIYDWDTGSSILI